MFSRQNLQKTQALCLLISFFGFSIAQTPGIECGCDKTGAYKKPSSKAIKSVTTASVNEGESSGGTYQVFAENAMAPNVSHVEVRKGSNTILSFSSRATGWGFSPDERSFVMHGLNSSGQHKLWMFNLDPDPSVEGEDAELVVDPLATALSSVSIRFSPHGKYLLYAGLGNSGSLMLLIYDTKTEMDPVYDIHGGVPITGLPSGKSVAGWGFSPDVHDRTFVHAFATNSEQYTMIAVNLRTGEKIVDSHNNMGQALFRFSPCGDYLLWCSGIGTNSQGSRFYPTSSPGEPVIDYVNQIWAGSETTETAHESWFLGLEELQTFPNNAGEDCPDDTPPQWPGGATLTASNITGSTVDLSWDAATGDNPITYRIKEGGSTVGELQDIPRFQVSSLDPDHAYNFKISAIDLTGNENPNGPSLSLSTKPDVAPSWPLAILEATNITGTSISLQWRSAHDDWGVVEYEIYRNGILADLNEGNDTTYKFKGLVPENTDTFNIKARDAAGQLSSDGPLAILSTAEDLPPYWDGEDKLYQDEQTETSISFHWDEANDDWGIDYYTIYRDSSEIGTCTGDITTCTDEGLEQGHSYIYAIEPVDDNGAKGEKLTAELLTLPSFVEIPLALASGTQWRPDIDGRLVVWEDRRDGDPDIWEYNLSTSETAVLAGEDASEMQARTSSGIVVWSDNHDIYMTDKYDPEHRVITVCDAAGDQLTPVTDGQTIVWTDERNGNWDIYMYDISSKTETAVCTKSGTQINPYVCDNLVVWEDLRHGNPDIYAWAISPGEEMEICRNSADQRNPVAEKHIGYRILWQDNRNGNWDIFSRAWFISGFMINQVYLGYTGNQTHPDISDGIMVYQDDRNGDEDIYSFRFNSAFTGEISPVCTKAGDQLYPKISQQRVVWEDHRNDDGDIYIWDRPPGTDLELSAEVNDDPIGTGKTLIYTLSVRNLGPDDESMALLACRLPAEAAFLDFTPSVGNVTREGVKMDWEIGPLKYDSTATLQIRMETFTPAILEFQAWLEGQGFDTDPSNNQAHLFTEVKRIAGETVGEGHAPSIVSNATGGIHLLYGSNTKVFMASRVPGAAWNEESNSLSGEYMNGGLAMDPSGEASTVFSDYNYDRLPKAYLFQQDYPEGLAGGMDVLAISDTGFHTICQEISPDGTRHMIYQQAPGPAHTAPLRYRRMVDSTWSDARDISQDCYDHADMCMDSQGYLHIAYFKINIGVVYRKSSDPEVSNWSTEEIIEPGWKGGQLEGMVVDLDVDDEGNPHLIYPGQVNGNFKENIKYAFKKDGEWHTEMIDKGDFFSGGNAIATGKEGRVHLCYFHVPSGYLRYATNVTAHWIKQEVVQGEFLWNHLDMDADELDNAHISYVINEKVKYLLRPPVERLTITPDTLDFGFVPVGDSVIRHLVLKNDSHKELEISSISLMLEDGFRIEFAPYTMPVGARDSIRISYAPPAMINSNTDLRVDYTGSSKLFVEIPVKAGTPRPELHVSPDPVSFGMVPTDGEEFRTVTISNRGSDPLIISSVRVGPPGGGIDLSSKIYLDGHNCTTLATGESCQAEISFYPVNSGVQTSYLWIDSNDPEFPVKQIGISGYGVQPRAQIFAKPRSLDFGFVAEGSSKMDSVILYNTGTADLSIYGISAVEGASPYYSIIPVGCGPLAPGDSCKVLVTLSPTSEGDMSSTLSIVSNSQFEYILNIPLIGNSDLKELLVSDLDLNFGEVTEGEISEMQILGFQNIGENDLDISLVEIKGRDYQEFIHTGWNGTLGHNEVAYDTIWFKPIFDGYKQAYLEIISEDSDQPRIEVPLSGIATSDSSSGDPDVKISISAVPMSGIAPLLVNFSAVATGGDAPYAFHWRLGNGTESDLKDPSHTFIEPGEYTVTAIVTDASLKMDSASMVITVVPVSRPELNIEASPMSGAVPLEVHFQANVTGGNQPVTYLWDFGTDGENSTSASPVFIYTEAGSYTARCTVSDQSGHSAMDSLDIEALESSYIISGTVMKQGSEVPYTSGSVELIHIDLQDAVSQAEISVSGEYQLSASPGSYHTVKFLPDEVADPGALPTYYGDRPIRAEALYIMPDSDQTGRDIHVLEKPQGGSGTGKITGHLVEGDASKGSSVEFGEVSANAVPVENTFVFLREQEGEILAGAATTDEAGAFGFHSLENSNYEFLADYQGIPMDAENPLLEISAQADSISIVATVSDVSIIMEVITTGIEGQTWPEWLEVYPNPADAYIMVSIGDEKMHGNRVILSLHDMKGRIIKNKLIPKISTEVTSLDVSDLAPALYLLKIETRDEIYSARIIIR